MKNVSNSNASNFWRGLMGGSSFGDRVAAAAPASKPRGWCGTPPAPAPRPNAGGGSVATLALGEEGGGPACPPRPPVCPPGPKNGGGMATTLAVGEEGGGCSWPPRK